MIITIRSNCKEIVKKIKVIEKNILLSNQHKKDQTKEKDYAYYMSEEIFCLLRSGQHKILNQRERYAY